MQAKMITVRRADLVRILNAALPELSILKELDAGDGQAEILEATIERIEYLLIKSDEESA
jgi:hypothetical protein